MSGTYVTLTIIRRIKVIGTPPDNLEKLLEDQVSVEYPIDCKEVDGSVAATIE
jgi:hypothetical protein